MMEKLTYISFSDILEMWGTCDGRIGISTSNGSVYFTVSITFGELGIQGDFTNN